MGLFRNANRAVLNANRAINNVEGQTNYTLWILQELLKDVQDGVHVKLVRVGDDTIMDFLLGRCDELPLEIEIDVREEEDESA